MNFGRIKGAGASPKVAAQGSKRARSATQDSPSPDLGPQLVLTAPSAAESSPPRKQRKAAGAGDISGGGEGSAGPATLQEDLPLTEVRKHRARCRVLL